MEKKFRILLLLVSLNTGLFLNIRAQNEISQDSDDHDELTLSLIAGPSKLEEGTRGELSVVADGGVEPLIYKWSDGREGVGLNKISIAPKEDTIYTVTVIDSSNPPMVKIAKPFTVRLVKSEDDEDDEESDDSDDEKEDGDESDDDADESLSREPSHDGSVKDKQRQEPNDYQRNAAAATIVGNTEYQVGDIIQLVAKPDGLNYQWTGPASFGSTAQRISLFATPEAAGVYTVEARGNGETYVARVDIGVEPRAGTTVQAPLPRLQLPIVPLETKERTKEAIKRHAALLHIKTSDYKVTDDEVSFTVTVVNKGKATASNVLIADVLPHCCTLVHVEGDDWEITSEGNKVQAWRESLNAHERKSIFITARFVYEPTEVPFNVATVTSDNTALAESHGRLG